MSEGPKYDYLRNGLGHRPGLITPADKGKLDGILAGASRLATSLLDGLMSAADWQKVNTPPTVRVHRNGALNIPNNALTAITWDATDWDTHAMWGGGNPTRLVAPAGWGGYWQVNTGVAYLASALGTRRDAYIRQAGGTYLADSQLGTGSATTHTPTVSDVVFLAAGQYLETVAFQDTGGILGLNAGFYYTVWCSMAWLRP